MVDYVGQQLGNYRILRLLGTGGFADVYLGEHMRLNTQAAIKVLHTRLVDKEMRDFLKEARIVARLDHPNIVRVMEFDVQAGIPFLVMAYAPNRTLRQRHPVGQRLTLATIIPYVKQVADALQYAHESQLIHRDIKPENMLVGRRNEILLSDFGIATLAPTSRSATEQKMAGTAAYMAPEQIEGHSHYASDQYSLGIVVYEWLGGEHPFSGSFIQICTQQLCVTPPSLRTKIPDVSPNVDQVVLKALEKDFHQRFPSVQAFAEALEEASKTSSTVATMISSHRVDPTTVQTCRRCGKPILLNAAFCGNCGYSLEEASKTSSTVATMISLHRVDPTTVQTCRRCGKPILLNAAFCGNCGYSFTEAEPTILRSSGYAPPIRDTSIPVRSAQPYLFPAQKPGRKRDVLIVSTILLVILVILGIIGYPTISMLLYPKKTNFSCLSSTQNLLVGDCFQENTNKWDLTSQPNQYSASISHDSLILEADNNALLPETIPANPHLFTDFRLEVDADLSQGDPINGYGVIIRGALDARGRYKTYYRFELFGTGQYAIYKGVPSGNSAADMKLVDFTSNGAIHQQGSINHLSLIAKGANMTLTVNGVMLHSITDSDYNTGYVALFVSNVPSAAQVAQATFSKLGVYQG